jgi:hypothetical protein
VATALEQLGTLDLGGFVVRYGRGERQGGRYVDFTVLGSEGQLLRCHHGLIGRAIAKNNSNKSNTDKRQGRFSFAFHMPEQSLRDKQQAENSLKVRGIFWLTVRNGAIYDAPARQRKNRRRHMSTTNTNETRFSVVAADGHAIEAYAWATPAAFAVPRAVVQLVHGMSEHSC